MTDHVFSRRWPRSFIMTAIILSVGSLLITGCAGAGNTQAASNKSAPDKLYQVSTEEALTLAGRTVAEVLPDQKRMPLKKPRLGFIVHETKQEGHYKIARFTETSYIYEIDLIRLEGETSRGESVTGYTYAVKGSGDLKAGPQNQVQIEQRLKEAFQQSGRMITVVSTRTVDHRPSVIGSSPKTPVLKSAPPPPTSAPSAETSVPLEKPVVQQLPAAQAPMAPEKAQPADTDDDVFIKLKKLKELRDQNIITEEEFQKKKKELLERI